jgi:nucleoside-diphosphate-sugar epimerase
MRVIVTGSQGFIGSYLCQELLNNGYEVVGIDNYSKYGVIKRPQDDHEKFSLIKYNLSSGFPDIPCDYLIAGAAMIGGISYFHKHAYDLLATNERIIANTFDYAIRSYQNSELKKIVVLSSSMVFENTSTYPTPESVECLPPSSTYGFQKLSCEYFCKGANEQYDLPYTIVRPFNCVGVGEDEALSKDEVTVGNTKLMLSHVLPDLINKALSLDAKDQLPILGDGKQVRHYTNGKDIARGIRLAMESDLANCNDFNISSSVATTVEELATIVWNKIHNCNPTFKYETPFLYDVRVRSPLTKKAEEILGFKCEISLEESVDEVINYMRFKNV